MNKKTVRGPIVVRIESYQVRPEMKKGAFETRTNKKVIKPSNTMTGKYNIYRGKKQIKGGFASIATATKYITDKLI